jgi:hypothetical protein
MIGDILYPSCQVYNKDSMIPASVESAMKKFVKTIFLLILMFSYYGCVTESKEVTKVRALATVEPTEEQAYRIGVQAYVYGYPLVLADVTNVDTLYSSAWLDLSREPIVLSVPDTGGRYYVIQMMDGWTETFALLGKRTTGTQAGHFLIVGPDSQGPVPSNVEAIKAPTNTVWIIGRTQTNGVADYSNVHAIQQGYRLTPLSA